MSSEGDSHVVEWEVGAVSRRITVRCNPDDSNGDGTATVAGGLPTTRRLVHGVPFVMNEHPIVMLLLLALPVASIAWTITHEEVFREPHEWLVRKSQRSRTLLQRKFFYLFTCEYCFSHYVSAALLVITRFTLIYDDWRGYLVSFFALVWVANVYMSAFGRLRLEIKKERVEIEAVEAAIENGDAQPGRKSKQKT